MTICKKTASAGPYPGRAGPRRLPLPLVAAALAAVLGISCVYRPEGANLDGQDVEVVFIHTSDIHSRLLPYRMDVGAVDDALGLKQQNEPFGGVARLSSIVRQERRNNARMAYIDSGDVYQGAPIFNVFQGEAELKAMNQLGVDALAIGNHEFDNGAFALVEMANRWANFPMLAANYLLQGGDLSGGNPTGKLAEPYVILNLQGLRVAVIGLGDQWALRSSGIFPLRTVEVLQQYVDFLRPLVDLVAVTSHTGYHDDIDLIPRVEGVDIYFGGHLHIALNPPSVIQDCDIARLRRERDKYDCYAPEKLRQVERGCESRNGCELKPATEAKACQDACRAEALAACAKAEQVFRYAEKRSELDRDIQELQRRGCHPRDVLLVHSGAFLKYAGRLQVTLRQCLRLEETEVCAERDADGACLRQVKRRCVGDGTARNDWEVASFKYQLLPIDKRLPEDPKMLALLEPYILELHRQQNLTQVIGFTAERLRRFSSGTGDSQVGNLVTDALQVRNQVWADFSLTNTLGIRSDIVAGAVDEEQMTNVFPFENTITVMYVSGQEVQEMMDFVAQRSASRGCQPQAQVAGLTAILNCGGCPGKGGNTCVRDDYDGEPCAQRVTIGGSGRACLNDDDCATDEQGKPAGEICTGQSHPDPALAGKKRCWMPISCTRSYRLATNDYVAKGGSGFAVLGRNTTQVNLGIPLRDATKDYIANMRACSAIVYPYTANKPSGSVLADEDKTTLVELEKKARDGDAAGATAGFHTLRSTLSARLAVATDHSEQRALTNYLACTDDSKSSDGTCVGLACAQIEECAQFQAKDMARCQAIGRVRAARRCVTLPCIRAAEDGRIQRIYKDSAGSPNPFDPWPED